MDVIIYTCPNPGPHLVILLVTEASSMNSQGDHQK